jgi:hypothetical protein
MAKYHHREFEMKIIIIITILFTLSGCAIATAPITLSPSGGSKSDATVEMAFSVGVFRKAVIDWKKTDLAAKARCTKWGFNGAERFSRPKKKCVADREDGDCFSHEYTYTYQCTE